MRQTWISRGLAALLALVLCLGLTGPALAAEPPLEDLTYSASATAAGALVRVQEVSGEHWLFLPASADLTRLALQFSGGGITLSAGGRQIPVSSGVPFDLTALYPAAPAEGVYSVTLTRGSQRLDLKIMASAGVRSLYLTSADPAKDRAWVELDKENKAKGQAVLLRADGTAVYDGALTQIKGRGNSTWSYPKKPYQIKLDQKTDLLETGQAGEAAKTWVLLANYADESLIHNTLTFDLAAELGLAYSPHSAPVDLYYDGEYRGSYLLCEKTEVGTGRVEVADLEEAFEEANPEIEDFDRLPTVIAQTPAGGTCQYVEGLNNPQDLTGGYLLEMDFYDRAKVEKSYFVTGHGQSVVSKSPEYLSKEGMDYISSLYQDFEDAVWNGGTHPTTGKDYTDYVDLESLAKCYLILELSQDGDAYQSSTYFYKPAGQEKLYAGPVWDFDTAYGSNDIRFPPDTLVAGRTNLGHQLLELPSFREAIQTYYQESLNQLVTDLALSHDPQAAGERLGSIAGYGAEVAASQKLDHVLWPDTTPADYDGALQRFQDYLTQRNQWLYPAVMSWEEAPVLSRFMDVPLTAWFTPAVEYVSDRGLFSGTEIGIFSPYETMTRAMAVTVLYRLAGQPATEGTSGLTDVEDHQWYAQAVAWGLETGVVDGYDDNTFRPDQEVSRQELVTFFYRYAQAQGADTSAPAIPAVYTDRDQVEPWAEDAFAWAIHRGVVTGTRADRLSPLDSAQRCEAAAMLQRLDQTL